MRWLDGITDSMDMRFSKRIGEGNGNPLQCSCLENPRDGEAWWTAVYGVPQSRTWLKWLSSSSSSYYQGSFGNFAETLAPFPGLWNIVVFVQLLSRVWLFATPWTATHQDSLSFTVCWNLPRLMSVESVMPPNHLIVTPFSSCPQSFPSSGSFPMSWLSCQVAKVLEPQLQHQSFQWIFRTDFL